MMEVSAVRIAIKHKKFIKGKRDDIEDLSLAYGLNSVVQESKAQVERKSRAPEKKFQSFNLFLDIVTKNQM